MNQFDMDVWLVMIEKLKTLPHKIRKNGECMGLAVG